MPITYGTTLPQREFKNGVEQIKLFRQLWSLDRVSFSLTEDRFEGVGISPRLNGEAIQIWIGVSPEPPVQALERIGRLADRWFAMYQVNQPSSQHK